MQAACASAIRNIVCRDKGLGAQFIDLGVEDLLNLALLKHGDKVDIKSIFRGSLDFCF